MKRYLLYIVLTVVLSTAGCTRGQWLDEVVAQRDEQEEVVPILRAAKEKGLTVDSAEEIERTNKYYTVDTANGYYNEFKRYRLVFSDKTTVEFDVLGLFNGVKREYYAERGLDHIGYIDLVDVLGNLVIDIVQSDDMIVSLSFQYTSAIDDPNDNITYEIYYTSTDGQVVTPNDTTAFGANIVSNTYENGQGVITFDGNVTKIESQAFNNCATLATITLPESVTSIGYYAFGRCSNLASILIPERVTKIGTGAFQECSSLSSITIPESVTSIGSSAFRACSKLAEFSGKFASGDGRCLIIDGVLNTFASAGLTEYTIPEGVTSIGNSAFGFCSSLTSITIPEGVTSIGDDVFMDCSKLTSVTISNSVTSIGRQAFWSCSSLASITIPDSVTSIGSNAFYYCRSLAEVYCKPTTPPTAYLGGYSFWEAFDYNASGRKIYVPEESVEAYKNASFWNEYANAFVPYDFEKGEEVNLESRKIYYTSTDGNVVTPYATNVFGANIISNTYENGKGVITFDGEVTEVGSSAFYGCRSLASITIPDSVTLIGFYAFIGCTSLASITIPEGVPWIGNQAFEGCESLASITIPDSVTSIGSRAFYNCLSLVSITIPESVTSIGSYVFAGCSGLTEFKGQLASDDGRCLIINGAIHSFAPAGLTGYAIPEGVTSIVATAFYGCASLINITIPDSVTYIGEWAFKDCLSLTSVYCMPTTPPTGGTGRFDNGVVGRKIYVPAESIEAYKSANYWSEYADDFVAYDFEKGEVVNLENRKIYYTSTDGNVVTPFCSGTSYFGANIVSNTYKNGQGVITFDGNVTSIGNSAFYKCSSLASITIPESVSSIGSAPFLECKSLAEFRGKFASEDGCCLIVDDVFKHFAPKSELTEYTIPDSVTSIGNSAFSGCTGLASISIPDGVTEIGNSAFSGCTGLASVTIGNGVTSIGEAAFYGCSSLTSITIPDSVTSIGRSAFAYCSSLASVTIGNGVTSIGEDPFSGCSSLAEFSGKFASEDGRCLIVDGVLHFFTPAAGLTEYVIPNGVTTIGVRAFYKCDELVSVTIPDGVTSIKDDAFRWCYNLASINIPEGVTEIGDYAFGSAKLTSVTLPESLTSLGYIAFAYCSSLKEVYCKAITPPTADLGSSSYWDAFKNNASGRKIYVPEESVEAYKTAEWWSDYANAIVGYSF